MNKEFRAFLPLPHELILDIFEYLPDRDRWSLASVSRSLYGIGREHFLYRTLWFGWWDDRGEYKRILQSFDLESLAFDPNRKLKEEIKFVEEERVGPLIRTLGVAFRKEGVDADAILRRLTSLAPNLKEVKLFGCENTQLFKNTITILATTNPQLEKLILDWRWSIAEPREEVVEISECFPRLHTLRLILQNDSYGDYGTVGHLATPLLQDKFAPNLKHLRVEIINDSTEHREGIDWRNIRLGSRLLTLDITVVYVSSSSIEDTLSGVSHSLPRAARENLEAFRINVRSLRDPPGFEYIRHWFGRLKKCRSFSVNFWGRVPNFKELDGEVLSGSELKEVKRAVLKGYMARLAAVMPALKTASWDNGDECMLEMRVERYGASGIPSRMNFKRRPEHNAKQRDVKDEGQYDFSEEGGGIALPLLRLTGTQTPNLSVFRFE